MLLPACGSHEFGRLTNRLLIEGKSEAASSNGLWIVCASYLKICKKENVYFKNQKEHKIKVLKVRWVLKIECGTHDNVC
ncbi:hypothetical protein EMIT019CA3_11120 [Bacillus pseudomycoides]